ncbi:hypothetical protein CBF17_016305 [Pantoea agglomerans]|uniref:hypothetical protein n=1 Tax=Enterobacter agglomerans TaxID=549 RepID=UPI000B347B7E|nr:hypothetical protein [Pantoea agglomerans]PHP92800.1 hypothetical protein CBF17_016305 [Pantoea agglomerans]
MTENSPDKLLLDALAPDLLRQYIDFQNINILFSRSNVTGRAKEEIDIHLSCVKNMGGEAIGSVSLKENLSLYQGRYVYSLAGYDRSYGFELYLNDKQTEVLGVMIVRLRNKSVNEIQWEKERLGIKYP